MAYATAEVVEIEQEAAGVGGLVRLPGGWKITAGQYLLGFAAEAGDLLPAVLYPAGRVRQRMLAVAAPIPLTWTAGTRLTLRGPLGRGFHLPESARQVALAAVGGTAARLLPLAEMALERGGAVALYTAVIPRQLPAAVEVLPLEELPQGLQWADYLALDVPRARLGDLRGLLGLRLHESARVDAQVLVTVDFPCGGVAECGACTVHTRSGPALACKDGPVFPLGTMLV